MLASQICGSQFGSGARVLDLSSLGAKTKQQIRQFRDMLQSDSVLVYLAVWFNLLLKMMKTRQHSKEVCEGEAKSKGRLGQHYLQTQAGENHLRRAGIKTSSSEDDML